MMDRNREARRAAMVTAANGISRRRHRTTTGSSSLRDSPEDEGIGEMQETGRLRDRPQKKERDRDRERDHRDRDRDRDQDRTGRSKRRRSEKYVSGGREEGNESSEESVNDEEDEDLDDAPPVRYAVPNPAPMMSSTTSTSSLTNQNHLQRKSYPPPPNKVFRPVVPTWKAPDEMIGVSIPRKARSASTKRSHDTWSFGGLAGGEPIHRQASPSPVRSSVVSAHAAASPSSAPMSPSSSNASLKKKLKPNGQKQRPPKSSSKSSPSIQDEIEIEVAEVLYGLMRQSQPPPARQEPTQIDQMKLEREINRSSGDSRSRVSSPVSNSNSGHPQPAVVLPQNSSSHAAPFTVTAPKRKRPRQLLYQEENQSVFYGQSGHGHVQGRPHLKVEVDNVSNDPSPSLEKNSSENGPVSYDILNSQARNESTKPDHSINHRDPKSAGESESRDSVTGKMEDALGSLPVNRLDSSTVKSSLSLGEKENHRLDKLEIDLMAPPPQLRSSSPERVEGEGECGGGGGGGGQEGMEESQKSVVADRVAVGGGSAGGVKYSKTGEVEDDKMLDKSVSAGGETNVRIKKLGRIDEAADHQKPSSKSKDGSLDIHLDLEKTIDVKKLNTQQHLKQQQPTPQKSVRDDASADKSGQSSSLQLQMSATAAAVAAAAAGWPGGIPPMGYVAPLQGVVPMDGSTMAPPVFQPPHFLFSQPRPKRCATHCYVAKNIQCHQKFLKMNSFWPAAAAAAAAAGSAPLFGTRPPYNLNMVPAADSHGNAAGRSANPAQEKGQGQAITFFPGQPSGTEKVPPAGSGNAAGAAQKKQFLLPQSLPPGAPANIMHGPFLFPLGQQQAATTVAAASATACPPGMLTVPAASAASTSGSASTPVAAATSVAAGVSPAMSFNFPNMPNMPGNETQYLAILGNSAYPFPFPAHVGAPTYGGAHAQAMPFFNGSFYPSQMLHPSQLQAAQQPLQGHQITNVPNAASSSQKHMQNQQRTQGGSTNGGSSNPIPQSFPASKNRATQPPQHEMGGEDSPSTADSRASRQNMGVYGTNFTLPIHPPNFFLTPAALVGSTNASGSTNHGEKKQHHQSQQAQALKSGMESMTPPAFTMSFASINGTASGFDISTMAQNHAIFQSLPPGARNHQMMAAAAQAAQQKKSYRPADDGKAGGADSSNGDEEMKSMAARASTSGGHGQSIAFSRSDMPDTSVPTMAGNNVVDSSARSFNLLSSQPRASRSSGPTAIGNASGPNSQQQQHQQQQMQQQQFQQQQQRLHLQKQHQAAVATRGKTSTTSNGNAYMDHHLSSSSPMPAKFPSGISGFPPSIVQNSSSPSPQVSSSSIPVSASAAMKNLPQQKSRPQQGHTQISFGTNQKPTAPSQPQQMPSSHQAPSSPMMVGSPSTSSLSKSAGGSPRTTASGSTGNKISQASSHPPKNSSVVQNQKSSPVGGRNAQSILGSPHISTSTGKPQLQQQQHPQHQLQQPQLSRQAIQQTQLYFSNAYPQPPHNGGASSATATASGYYLQKHRSEHPQQGQKSHGSGRPTSSGIMSLSPVSLVSTSTTDPAKAVAAAATATAASSMKMPSPAVLHGTQFSGQPPSNMQHQMVPAGFSYVPAADQVKPAEQKQPAGNDNLHSSWQPERK